MSATKMMIYNLKIAYLLQRHGGIKTIRKGSILESIGVLRQHVFSFISFFRSILLL